MTGSAPKRIEEGSDTDEADTEEQESWLESSHTQKVKRNMSKTKKGKVFKKMLFLKP